MLFLMLLLYLLPLVSIMITRTSKRLPNDTCQTTLSAANFARFTRSKARVVEWQTRTFEGRMPKGMRVQVPPRAPLDSTGGNVFGSSATIDESSAVRRN